MTNQKRHAILMVDLLGGAAVAACLFGFVWLTVIRCDDVSAQISDLQQEAKIGTADLASLRAVRDRQRALYHQRREELGRTGRLPDETPIELYFQTLSELASQHGLQVLGQRPVSPRRYPGLLEQRYGYELSGTFPDIVRFLRAIEDADFWADISYLTVKHGRGQRAGVSKERVASLTISLFSALPIETQPEEG